jgi:hypothetical protein
MREFQRGFVAMAVALIAFFTAATLISGVWFGFRAMAFLLNIRLAADFALIILLGSVLAGLLHAFFAKVIAKISN